MSEQTEIEVGSAVVPRTEVEVSTQRVEMADILSLAKEGVDPETVGRMVDLYERVHSIQAEQAYNRAMLAVQQHMQKHPIPTRGKVVVSKSGATRPYPLLQDIQRSLAPVLAAHGLSYSFDTETTGKGFTVITRVSHVMGVTRETRTTLPLDESGSKNQVQGVGSTESYGMRYGLIKAFGLTRYLHDNDGAGEFEAEDAEAVSEEQLATLTEWTEKLSDTQRKKFEKEYLPTKGVDSLADLPASLYRTVLADLKRVVG